MESLNYLEKRDENGVLLRFSAQELIFKLSNSSFDLIQEYHAMKVLTEGFSVDYVSMYYKRMFYDAFVPIGHQLAIKEHDKKHLGGQE